MLIFERTYPVNVTDADLTGRLSPGSLFNYFQDLAGRHASSLGFGREHLMTSGFFWVLSRMTVEIVSLPVQWDEVTVRTWPRGTDTIFALRDFEMFDTHGNRMAGATSSWVIVDYETRRVQRPDKALSFLNARFPDQRALDTNACKIPPIPPGEHIVTAMKAKLDDIDINMHVNNARYLHWVMNCYEPEFISSFTPDMIEVNYLAEGHRDDMINIITEKGDTRSGSFIHSVIREGDSTELCRIRIRWKENKLKNLY
jgi:medium-chain acyl-[acyl-carrier-protein] hydrolase